MSTSGGHSRLNVRSIRTQLEVAIIHEIPPSLAAQDSAEEPPENGTRGASRNPALGSQLKKLSSQGSVDLFSAEFEECMGDNEAISLANSLAELRALELNGGPYPGEGSMDSESWPAPPDNLDQFAEEEIAAVDSGYCDKQQYAERPLGLASNGNNEIPEGSNATQGSHIIPDYTDNSSQRTTQTLRRRPHQYENIEFIDDNEDETKRNTWPLQNHSNIAAQRSSAYENVEVMGKKQLSLISEASHEDSCDNTPTNSEDNLIVPGAKVERLLLPPPLVTRERGEQLRQQPPARSRRPQYENFVLPREHQPTTQVAETDMDEVSRQVDIMPHRNLPPASILRNQMQKQRALSVDSAQSDLSADDAGESREPVDVFEKGLEELSDEDSWFSDSDFDSDEDEAHSLAYDQESVYSGDGSTCSDDSKDQTFNLSPAKRDPLFAIVFEFLKTEKAYVDKLHFICRVVLLNLKVLDRIPGVCSIRPESVHQIFSNIEAIYAFHSGSLLPKLEERVTTWSYNKRLGDLLKEMIPYLSLYLEYTENFKKSLGTLEQCRLKNQVFGALMDEVEKTAECRRLSLKQHLLDIVHRVQKYQAITKDYLDHLPDDSEDKSDASEASNSLNMAALELDRAMGKDDRLKKLKEIQQKIDPANSLLSPTREYITEGRIKTVSVKGISTIDRYIFLFNDTLLLCGSAGLGGKHKVKKSIDMDGMQIHDGDNLVVPHTFYIQSRTKAIEFHASSTSSKNDWVKAIRDARDQHMTWKLSEKPLTRQTAMQEEQLGKMAPKTITRQSKAIFCRLCAAAFGSVSKRNECKACGQVFCPRCCTQKARLAYDSNRLNRVCDECYIIIRNRDLGESEWETPEGSVSEVSWRMSGAMQFTGDAGSHWKKRWFTLRSDGFLLCYKKKGDKEYLTSLPLKRFAVGATIKSDPVFKANAYKLYNLRKTYFFQANDVSIADRWIQNLADYTDSAA